MFNWKYFGKVHKLLYRLSGGRLGTHMGWIKVALIDTVGRKTGKRRTVPLACYPYRDTIVVSASNSGQESHPAWYLNLKAHPEVTVQVGRERFRAMAEDVPEQERDTLWPKIVEMNKHQGDYLQNVSRTIPLVWFRRI